MNSFAPSVLVEMGFLTNAVEYDDLTSREGIFKTANAVGDSIVTALR
jgi:N-acetylmuramoyl-L-alanine amidase